MATLTYNGESFSVDHAVKGADYIHGYDASGILVVSFEGVADFSRFTYTGTYMNPGDCLTERCNDMVYCGGVAKTRGGTAVPASAVGLGNVNNTSDANKPVSTAQAAAIADAKAAGTAAQNNLNSHTGNKSNPHGVTAAQVGAEPATADGTYPQCYYRMVDGEQEWLNPPMNPGTKYRTTERFRNKVVYTMIIDCGNWSDGKVVTANAGSTPYPIAFRGYAGPYAIPFINAKSFSDGSTTYVKVDRTGTNLRVTLQAGTGHTQYTYVQVWFVH